MTDQAHNLRKLVVESRNRARVLAVTSGKGGVGKTSTSINLAIVLARHGAKVVVLDADLGLANVEVLLGLSSPYTLQDVIRGERTMLDILVSGPGGIQIVPGSSGIAKLADLGPKARENILGGLHDLQNHADFIIIDTMAGIGQNAVAFAAAADEILLVTTPEPSAIIDGYAMIKTICRMRDDATIHLVVNQVVNVQQAKAVSAKLSHVAQTYLGHRLSYVGHILRDPHVGQAVMQCYPFVLGFPNAPASACIDDLATRILLRQTDTGESRPGFFTRLRETLGLARTA